MHHNLILYCKSYRGDLKRAIRLYRSIEKYNKDEIPFYISVPNNDKKLFQENCPNAEILVDQEVLTENTLKLPGNLQQQFIKAYFYKLKISRFYFTVDSDGYFIRDFYVKDFLYTDDIPYTACHERKDLFEFTSKFRHTINGNPEKFFRDDCKAVMSYFAREGKIYDWGPNPLVWDTEVWEELDNHIIPIEQAFLRILSSELKWYGETYLYLQKPLMPCEPFFKGFHYKSQYEFYKQLGYKEEHFAENYLGLVMQSNFSETGEY